MSREPWNTGAALAARICRAKSLDKRFTDYPLKWERGNCAFPCFRRGRVRAEPGIGVKGIIPLRVLRAAP